MLTEPLDRRKRFDGTIRANRHRIVHQLLVRHFFHAIDVNRVNTSKGLLRRDAAAIHLHLHSETCTDTTCLPISSTLLEESSSCISNDAFNCLFACSTCSDVTVSQTVRNACVAATNRSYLHRDLHQSRDRLLRTLRIHSEQRGVLVAREESAHRVGEVFMCDRRTERRWEIGSRSRHAIPLSHHRLNDHEHQRVCVRPALRLERHRDGAEGVLVILR